MKKYEKYSNNVKELIYERKIAIAKHNNEKVKAFLFRLMLKKIRRDKNAEYKNH